ncbi:MAG TPA: hypothetical protein VHL11_00240, partial [Phototrophicaceae bacterium]|nr:hypothetical protein [Phototrophicaceae bacterium]
MLRIALAPVGAGKTEAALTALTSVLQHKPFARVWVLLATRRQQDTFRQRLIELDDGRSLYFNVEFFNFYELYRRLLNIARQPARGLADSARFGLLRMVIGQLKAEGALPLYSAIADTPGFLRIVADLIFELKQNQVYPDAFLKAAGVTRSRKDNELAAIYDRYQQILREYNLVDREGEGWLALERLKNLDSKTLALDLLVVDGFDQFTVVQAKLLQELSYSAADTLVTLTSVPGREGTIGRRFQRALETLHRDNFPVRIETLFGAHERHPDIQRLSEHIFLPKMTNQTSPSVASDGLILIEAPDAASEVGAVLRRVKRMLVNGVPPDYVLIALRDWTRYQPHFVALAKEYHIPLALHTGEALKLNPAITVILKVLELHTSDFRRRDLLDVLRSPYIHAPGLELDQAALLENVSQQFTVTGGTTLWKQALQYATRPTYDEDNNEQTPLLDEFIEANLSFALEEFIYGVTPPEVASTEDYVAWLEDLIGLDPVDQPDDDAPDYESDTTYTVSLIQALREADEDTRTRDLVALQEFKHVLRGLLASQELLTWLSRGQTPSVT